MSKKAYNIIIVVQNEFIASQAAQRLQDIYSPEIVNVTGVKKAFLQPVHPM